MVKTISKTLIRNNYYRVFFLNIFWIDLQIVKQKLTKMFFEKSSKIFFSYFIFNAYFLCVAINIIAFFHLSKHPNGLMAKDEGVHGIHEGRSQDHDLKKVEKQTPARPCCCTGICRARVPQSACACDSG